MGCVAGFGSGIGINIEAQWGARHHGEGLVLTNVKHTGCVQVTQVLLELARLVGLGGCGALVGHEHVFRGIVGSPPPPPPPLLVGSPW